MVQSTLVQKLDQLPEALQTGVLHYVEFLLEKYAHDSSREQNTQPKRQAGLLKGKIWMSEDFDEPLEELKDYM
ncbi:MAG: DUF2281 domain-containing protein [Kamptonema sp. SIO4C4]|nr:DUF2281 domain-containing protein [Kamptonema sp. SIO4C4]